MAGWGGGGGSGSLLWVVQDKCFYFTILFKTFVDQAGVVLNIKMYTLFKMKNPEIHSFPSLFTSKRE